MSVRAGTRGDNPVGYLELEVLEMTEMAPGGDEASAAAAYVARRLDEKAGPWAWWAERVRNWLRLVAAERQRLKFRRHALKPPAMTYECASCGEEVAEDGSPVPICDGCGADDPGDDPHPSDVARAPKKEGES